MFRRCWLNLCVVFQYREKRLEEEKDLLQKQTVWLNAELKAKTEELISVSREKGKEILELKCNLENKKDEVLSFCYSFKYLWADGLCKSL